MQPTGVVFHPYLQCTDEWAYHTELSYTQAAALRQIHQRQVICWMPEKAFQ